MSDRLYRKKTSPSWYGQYYDLAGKRVTRSLRTTDKKVARAKLLELEREAIDPRRRAKNEATESLRDTLEYLVQHGCSECAEATIKMYAKKAGHLLRLLDIRQISELTREDVQRFINQRIEEGAAPTTVQKELITLRRALREAQERGRFDRDVAALIPKLKAPYHPRRRYLSVVEFELLLMALPAERRRWLVLAVYTGARFSEVERLEWSHVNLDAGQLLLPGTKTVRSVRWIPIAEPLAAELGRIPAAEREGHVVDAWQNVRRDLRAACERAGIGVVSPNDLRRTFASWLKQAGVDSMTVGRLLGHTTSRMVDLVYGHLDDATKRRAIAHLPSLPATPVSGSASVADGGRRKGSAATLEEADGTKTAAKNAAGGVPRDRIELPTRGFSIPCSTN
jgi:integrase